MNCPKCNVSLIMSERQGVEIDYCPQCRGIWLDRGELDKIIERSAEYQVNQGFQDRPEKDMPFFDHHDHKNHHDKHNPYYQGRRKSWLQDLFD